MQVRTVRYNKETGWDIELPAAMDSEKTLVVVFGASSFLGDFSPFHQLSNAFPKSVRIGCSTAGEINNQHIQDESLVVSVVKFARSSLRFAVAPVSEASKSMEAGSKIAEELMSPDLQGVLIFSDGLNVNGTTLVKGLNSVLTQDIVIAGGLAADGDSFERTWVLEDGCPKSNYISAVGFYGDSLRFGHGSKGGWDIFGPERYVSKSDGNELFEVDGTPALELYKKYLGDLAEELPASALLFPLSMRSNESSEKRIVRTILGVNEETQSMIFAGDVPEGSLVQLMRANFDRLIDGASEAALMTNENCTDAEEVLSIAISCVGRRLILGERAEEELEAVMEGLPENTTQIGFYSYGEISPQGTGNCELHNQTMTLTTICEQ